MISIAFFLKVVGTAMGDCSSRRHSGVAKPRGRLARAMNQGSGSNWRGNNGGWHNAESSGQRSNNDKNWRCSGGDTGGHESQPRMSTPPVVEEDWDADNQDQYSSSTKQTQCPPPSEAHQRTINSWVGQVYAKIMVRKRKIERKTI